MQESSKFHTNQENLPNKQQMVYYYLLCSVSQCRLVIKSRQEIHLPCDLVSSAHDKWSQSCNYVPVSSHHHENAQLEGSLIPKCVCLKGIRSHYQKRPQHLRASDCCSAPSSHHAAREQRDVNYEPFGNLDIPHFTKSKT